MCAIDYSIDMAVKKIENKISVNQNLIQESNDAGLDMSKILLYSTQLGVHYELWENNSDIHSTLDVNKNSMCLMIKHSNPHLDDKSIKCIVMAVYIHLYTLIL